MRPAEPSFNDITNVSFDSVTDIHYTHSFLDSRFDVGTVKLNTAGSNDTELHIRHVEGARKLYDETNEKFD